MPNVSTSGANSSRCRRNDSSRSSRQKDAWKRGAASPRAVAGHAGQWRPGTGCRSGARRPGGRAAALQAGKGFDFLNQGHPVFARQAIEDRPASSRSPGRAGKRGRPAVPRWAVPACRCALQGFPQTTQRAGVPQGFPGHIGQRQPFQHQPDGQELDQAARAGRPHGPVAAFLEAQRCRPSRGRPSRSRTGTASHSGIGYAEQVRAIRGSIPAGRVLAFQAGQLGRQAAQPASGGPPGLGIQRRKPGRSPSSRAAASSGQSPGPGTPRRSGSTGR